AAGSPRILFGAAPAGVRRRLSPRRPVLRGGVSALGVASDVLHRRVARAPRSVRALPGAGIRRVAADARGVLEHAGAIDRPADAAVLVPGAVDDDDELRLPWHPGPLPHLSARSEEHTSELQ